jgi:hypothetical protein
MKDYGPKSHMMAQCRRLSAPSRVPTVTSVASVDILILIVTILLLAVALPSCTTIIIASCASVLLALAALSIGVHAGAVLAVACVLASFCGSIVSAAPVR